MAIRRTVPESLRVPLGSLRIWRDDLATMVKILRECVTTAAMTADDFEIDEVDDLVELPNKTVGSFTFIGDAGRVQLRLGTGVSLLEISDPNLAMRGAAGEVQKIASKRQRWMDSVVKKTLVWGGISFLTFFVAFRPDSAAQVLQSTDSNPWPLVIPLAIASAFVVLTIFLSALLEKRLTKVILYTGTRAEAPTFWQRKREDLVIDVTINLASLLLGVWLGYLLPRP